jgi:hypothetical protein
VEPPRPEPPPAEKPELEKPEPKSGGKDSPKEPYETAATVRTTSSESASGGPVPVAAPAAPSAVTTSAAPQATFELSNGSLSRSLAAARRREHAGRESEWLGVGAPSAAGSPGNISATATIVVTSLAVLGGRSAALATGGVARGDGGGSAVQGHSSVPTPGPGPGGSGGGAAAGGGTASASSASLTLVSVLLLAPPGVMRRLCVASRSLRETFFLLIPEKPD